MTDFSTLLFLKKTDHLWEASEEFLHNRAFLFGDGLFETMVFTRGKILDFELHRVRLLHGMHILGLDPEIISTQEELERSIFSHLSSSQILRVRWNVFRGGLGKYTPETDKVLETLQIQPFHYPPRIKKTAMISAKFRVYPQVWSNCKTSNALLYVLANQERQQYQQDDVILLDYRGNVSEAGAANLFWKKDGVYYTPSLSTHCIAGIGRSKIMQCLRNFSIPLIEGEFSVQDLLTAEKVFTSNVTGLSYIECIEGHCFNTESEELLDALFNPAREI
ncbi:aminotransferase class IV [Mongoliitalea daihaiensis]|uniref:aminotransferase class IV n=1 Tax=Mongoliitalea daihaiensis TaxID=2782006 RepID=UPI001F4291DA|nr:aminotransferase class IV [Mongoliitalea daihaiensis]UJP63365.1 aminotransferase class IV [Mongoliitalea daihaiensis]